jgi:hypothetical protein
MPAPGKSPHSFGSLLRREAGGSRFPCGVADSRREVTDKEDDVMALVLKMPQLCQEHRVTKVNIGRCRVETRLDPELFTG